MFAQRKKTVAWFLAVSFGFLAGSVGAETIRGELIQQINADSNRRPLVPLREPASSPQADYCGPHEVFDLSWSSDDSLLAVAVMSGNGTEYCHRAGVAQIYNTTTTPPELLYTLAHPGSGIWCVAFNKAGTLLAVGGIDYNVRIYDPAENFALLYTIHSAWAYSIDFSPDDTRMAVVGFDGNIRIYSMPNLSTPLYTPSIVRNLKTGDVWDVDFNSDGNLLAVACADKRVRIYDLSSSRNPAYTLGDGRDAVAAVAFNPDSTLLVSGGNDGKIRVYDMARFDLPLHTFSDWESAVFCLDFNRNGTILAATEGQHKVNLYDMTSIETRPVALMDAEKSLISVAFDHKGDRLAAGGFDGRVRIYSVSRDSVN